MMRTIVVREVWFEILKAVRMPAYAVPTLAFPLVFYVIFGLVLGGGRPTGGTTMATYMLATYGTFGVIGAALFGCGVSVAVERGQGWLILKRASPMPPLAYLVAKLAMAVLFAVLVVLTLGAVGATIGRVELAPQAWAGLAIALVAGALPACAFGLAIGYLAGPNSAVPIVNLIYLPVAFLSGLWLPIHILPRAVQAIAVWMPPYHHAQLALAAVGADRGGPLWAHVAVLAGATGLGVAAAWIGYLRDEGRTHG
ncbi:MAG: ABC transporter permease [Vicinamibacteraceae bacterium]|nr:ABC transporter permease [Vicinamibacteraceae bacterium]